VFDRIGTLLPKQIGAIVAKLGAIIVPQGVLQVTDSVPTQETPFAVNEKVID
jgi:hypothetical protein